MNEGGASVPEVSAQPVPGENEEAPKPQRRRTTRRKKDAEDASAAADVSAESAEQAEKPVRRRRARKKAAVAESAEAPAAEAPKAEAAAEEAPKPQRRRRTRKQASAEAAPAEPAPSETAPQEHADHESAEVPAEHEQRREREGRAEHAEEAAPAAEKQEHEAEPAAESSSEQQEGSASEHEHEHEERGRGRRRQNRRFERNGSEHQGGQNGEHNGERQEHGRFNQRNDLFNQRNNRQNGQNRRRNNRRQEVPEPSLTRDELQAMKVADLRAKAAELGVEYVGVHKSDLVEAVYQAAAAAEGFHPVEGILEIGNAGAGWVRTGNYMKGDNDAYVSQQFIRNYALRPGDRIEGTVGPARTNTKYPAQYPPLISIAHVNGRDPESMKNRPRFRDLTPIYPNERLVMECGKDSITGRAIDLVAPIGKGQRGLIVSPPKAGKTTVLKKICQSIAANNPEVHLVCLLVDERPEEVTDMQRSIHGEVVASTFDMPAENHTAVSELVIEHAKRLVELGEDVVVVLDSITRLARAYNLAQPASGRILSGGVDSAALYPPKKFLGAARNIENGGSLTIIASALVDTGSKMDEVIFEEFKGTGNMELKLDRELADKRIFPAIDPVSSGTRNEDLLLPAELTPFVWGIRRVLANMNNTERAASALVKGLKATNSNEEFLIRSAKKAAQSEYVDAL
jgi:transcription termination factor Rho